jgi:triosephosphate isomerase (TIM)
MRNKVVIGNWKMNKDNEDALSLIIEILYQNKSLIDLPEIGIAPPAIYLSHFTEKLKNTNIYLVSQNAYFKDNGAFTGEISFSMLNSIGVKYCILGHSERRQFFNETDAEIALKVKQSIKCKVLPVFCCGESKDQRQNDSYFNVIKTQLENSLFKLSKEDFLNVTIAYEPVWAIGTGLTASANQAQEMHAFIRNEIKKAYNSEVAEEIRILYGGSVNAKNAEELFACNDVDGGLVGGSSLNAIDFFEIIKAARS